jgi:D-alanyl-D-alanine carboxypeptidase
MVKRATMLVLGALTAALVLAMAGVASAQDKQSADARLDAALKELVAMPVGPPGVIAVVQRGQDREVHSFGKANLETGRRPRATDRMRIASTAKAFSGAVALSLVSKGALSLDDTIGQRLPDLPEAWADVTLRQLLNHTSGIPDFSQDPDFREALFASLAVAPPPEQLLTYIDDEDLDFDPGSQYRYSNSDNVIVALMVEAATNRTYEGQLQEQVYGPLGLQRTTLPAGTDMKVPFIHGYDNEPAPGEPPEDYSELIAAGWAWASGGVVSTPGDLNTFIRGYVGGDLFDRETRSQQRQDLQDGTSEPPGPGTNLAGLAIFRYDTKCGTVWGHTGNTLGYTQFMAASPNGRRSVTVSVNSQHTLSEGKPEVFRALRRAEAHAVCAALAGG